MSVRAGGAALLLGLTLLVPLAGAGPALARPSACTSGQLIEHWDGSAWSRVAAPRSDALGAVAAVSTADVWAVGASKALAEHWDGSGWRTVPMPRRRHGSARSAGVSAVGPRDVWAVAGSAVEHWNGSAWRLVPAPQSGGIEGIAALSARSVWAVGSVRRYLPQRRYDLERTLVLRSSGRGWRRLPSPNPSGGHAHGARRADELYAVAARSGRDVWAVGTYFLHADGRHRSFQTLVLHWDGRRWRRVPSPSPGGTRHADALYGVAVAGRDAVWAVGGYHDGHGAELPLVEHWNGRRWRVLPVPPLDRHSPDQALRDLSVVSPDDVWASGEALVDNGTDLVDEGFTEHWDGTSWSLVPSLHEWNAGDSIRGIAAVSASDAWAVGDWGTCS